MSLLTAFASGLTPVAKAVGTMSTVEDRGSWWPLVREPYAGAWQRNEEWSADTLLSFHAVFNCITLISSDTSKLRARLVELDQNGIWSETTSPAYSPVLRKPNHYQNQIQFKEGWIISKLTRGNTYVLKVRDERQVVVALYLLDPSRVLPLVSSSGDVYYQLGSDNLAGLQESSVTVPASEIIHDRMNCLFHPLVGISPIYACGLAAAQGLKIQENSKRFFSNSSMPGGVLTAPGAISDTTADRLKEYFDNNYSGANAGKVAVVGDGLKFEALRMTAADAQTIEQLKWSAETVCGCFRVPPYKVGVGMAPAAANIEAQNQAYYTDCLQIHIESMELCLDEGLGIGVGVNVAGRTLGVDLDLDGLWRMDTAALYKANSEAVKGGWMAPNEARKRADLTPKRGGETPYMQQQNYALSALADRDENEPFAKPGSTIPANPEPPMDPEDDEEPSADDIEGLKMMACFALMKRAAHA